MIKKICMLGSLLAIAVYGNIYAGRQKAVSGRQARAPKIHSSNELSIKRRCPNQKEIQDALYLVLFSDIAHLQLKRAEWKSLKEYGTKLTMSPNDSQARTVVMARGFLVAKEYEQLYYSVENTKKYLG